MEQKTADLSFTIAQYKEAGCTETGSELDTAVMELGICESCASYNEGNCPAFVELSIPAALPVVATVKDIAAPTTTAEAEALVAANTAAVEALIEETKVSPVVEVQATTVAPVVEAVVVQPTAVPTPVASVNDLENATAMGKIAYQTVLDYAEKMHQNKPLGAEEGSRNQVTLYRALSTIINTLDSDFNVVFGAVLKQFHEGRDGVFHEMHVFRFMEHLVLPESDRKAFQRLLNMMKLAADPLARSIATKQIDFEKTLEHGVTEAGKQKILSFFHVN